MAVLDALMVPRIGSFTLKDATGSPITVTVPYDHGNVKIGPFRAGALKQEVVQVRGIDTFVVETGEEEMGLTFDCWCTDFTDATEKLVLDAVRKTGAFAAGVSVLGANRPWGLAMVYTQGSVAAYGAGADSVITLAKLVDITAEFDEADKGKLSIKARIFNPSASVTVA